MIFRNCNIRIRDFLCNIVHSCFLNRKRQHIAVCEVEASCLKKGTCVLPNIFSLLLCKLGNIIIAFNKCDYQFHFLLFMQYRQF